MILQKDFGRVIRPSRIVILLVGADVRILLVWIDVAVLLMLSAINCLPVIVFGGGFLLRDKTNWGDLRGKPMRSAIVSCVARFPLRT